MVVEENPERCRHWCDLLSRHGLSVHAAPSAVLAMAAFPRQHPSVILTGPNQTDATTLVEQLRATGAHVPIIPLRPDLSDEEFLAEVDWWLNGSPAPSGQRRRLVLLVDDDARSRDILKVFLELKGLDVVTAGSGEEGLRYLEDVVPSAIVLDILMPGMGGLDMLKRLRATHPSLPVILISHMDDEEARQQAMTLRVNAYLVKPFEFDCLEELLNQLARGAGGGG